MIAVIGAIALVSMLAGATLAATNGDLNLTQRDLDYKRAHAAAEAGLADYSFHLNNDNSYWARCTEVPSRIQPERGQPGGLDRQSPQRARKRSRIRDRTAAGLHQPGRRMRSEQPDGNDARARGGNTGTFRIRSTGFSGAAKVPIVATYKRASLLDYIYFTQYETSDPATYSARRNGNTPTPTAKSTTAKGAAPGAPRSSSSAATTSRGPYTPTTNWRSAARRNSVVTPPT